MKGVIWIVAAAVAAGTAEGVVLRHSRVVARPRVCISMSADRSQPRRPDIGDRLELGASKSGSAMSRLARARNWARAALSSALLVGSVGAPAAHAGWKSKPEVVVQKPKPLMTVKLSKEVPELTTEQTVIVGAMTTAMAAGLFYYAKTVSEAEDKAEIKRVKEETERLKKMRSEFLMDEEVVKDDDLFSSLRKRMEKEGGDVPTEPQRPDVDLGPDAGPEMGGGPAAPPGDDFGGPPPPPQPPKPTPSSPMGTLEPPAPRRARSFTPSADTPPAPPRAGSRPAAGSDEGGSTPADDAGARDADIERLKRMFGN